MTIANVRQDGPWLYLYDERGNGIGTIPAKDGLVNFTSTTVSVKEGPWIYTYDEKGNGLGCVPG